MSADQEIAPRTSLKPLVQAWLERRANDVKFAEEPDWAGGVDSMAERILLAETEEEIFAAGELSGTTGGRDYVNEPFLLKSDDYIVRVSNIRDSDGNSKGVGYYLLMRVTDYASGEEKIINTGAPAVVTQITHFDEKGILAKYDEDGGMPMMIGSKPSGEGNVLFLKPFRAGKRGQGKKA
jgi:hypothetical protein